MKKITLTIAVLIAAMNLFSQTSTFKWFGGQTDQIWDYGTANWLDPAFLIPLPKAFSEGSSALFDDTSVEGSDTLKISGVISVKDININATKTYVLRSTSTTTDSIVGSGTLIKDGTGLFVMDCKNALTGGTIIKNGKLMMEKQTTSNIFGSKLVFEGGIANFATTSSSSYPSIKVPVEIPAGKTGKVELSRYSYWSSPITGSGNLEIYAGGERTYVGQKNVQPDWSAFTGNVTVYKYPVSGVSPGYYGIILNTNKTFKDSLDGFKVDSTFYNRTLTLGPSVVLTSESGTRAYAIGELNTEDSTSLIAGYYKESTTPLIFYFVGGLNTDVTLSARFGEVKGVTKGYTKVGLVKMGTGTYTLTNNNNFMNGGLIVRQGGILINDEVKRGPLYKGGLGNSAKVEANGWIGGTGRILGDVNVFGALKPGSNGIGTLLISDSLALNPLSKYDVPVTYSFKYNNTAGASTTYTFRNGGIREYKLTMQPGATAEFEIQSADSYDKVKASGELRFINDVSGLKPKIKVKLAPQGYSIKNGDRFELITAKKLNVDSQPFDIELPVVDGITWSVKADYDTATVDVETFNFTTHVTTQTNADSTAVTQVNVGPQLIYYKVIVIAQAGTGVDKLSKGTLSVYPNPVNDVLQLNSTEKEISTVQILNLQGQILETRAVHNFNSTLNVSNLPAGIYFAKIKCGNEVITRKIVRQ